MRSVLRIALALALAAPLLAGCGGDDAGSAHAYVALDGSPRRPDAQGVVTKVAADFSTLELDGTTYDVAKDLQCFSTQDGSTLPLRQRVGSYVHVGLRGKKVVWLASIANVVRAPGRDPVVYYVGEAIDLVRGSLVFRDGTVLDVAPSVDIAAPPKGGAVITVSIDPAKHAVVAVEPG